MQVRVDGLEQELEELRDRAGNVAVAIAEVGLAAPAALDPISAYIKTLNDEDCEAFEKAQEQLARRRLSIDRQLATERERAAAAAAATAELARLRDENDRVAASVAVALAQIEREREQRELILEVVNEHSEAAPDIIAERSAREELIDVMELQVDYLQWLEDLGQLQPLPDVRLPGDESTDTYRANLDDYAAAIGRVDSALSALAVGEPERARKLFRTRQAVAYASAIVNTTRASPGRWRSTRRPRTSSWPAWKRSCLCRAPRAASWASAARAPNTPRSCWTSVACR